MHISFPLLLALSVLSTQALHVDPWRGVGLWCALCLAVAVREVARAIAAAYAGLHLHAVLFLPIGGVMVLRSADGVALNANSPGKPDTRWVTASGPISNIIAAVLIAAMSVATAPNIALLAQPWIGLGHLLRSMIWIQIMLAIVSLLPTQTMPARQLVGVDQPTGGASALRGRLANLTPRFGLGTGLAFLLVVMGIVLPAYFWLSILGFFMLLYVQANTLPARTAIEGESILVRDVMLTEYTLLSSSDTLRDALDRSVHSLQEVFPVVRGDRLVGSIARQTIAERLVTAGDSYLQGVMRRSLQIAKPDEKLSDALRRASTLGASEFIPVVQDDSMVGIITHQSLSRAVQQVRLTRSGPDTHRDSQR